jgi:tRNA(adenine34) deaminase
MVLAALEVAEEGLAAGELPIGAVVAMGPEIIGRAFTQDTGQRRRLAHADLLAMIQADERTGWSPRPYPLLLAVNLEPCVMCMGAAMTLGITEVYFGAESPADGGARTAANWNPASTDMPGYAAPAVTGGIFREASLGLFRRYCQDAPESGFLRWAKTIAGQSA